MCVRWKNKFHIRTVSARASPIDRGADGMGVQRSEKSETPHTHTHTRSIGSQLKAKRTQSERAQAKNRFSRATNLLLDSTRPAGPATSILTKFGKVANPEQPGVPKRNHGHIDGVMINFAIEHCISHAHRVNTCGYPSGEGRQNKQILHLMAVLVPTSFCLLHFALFNNRKVLVWNRKIASFCAPCRVKI